MLPQVMNIVDPFSDWSTNQHHFKNLLSADDNSIWAFAAPASLVLCINLVLMITICYIISKLEYQG